jgi:hypothetical protein
MDDHRPNRSKARSYTLIALFGLFVGAVLVALTGRLLPRWLARGPKANRPGTEGR